MSDLLGAAAMSEDGLVPQELQDLRQQLDSLKNIYSQEVPQVLTFILINILDRKVPRIRLFLLQALGSVIKIIEFNFLITLSCV